MLGEKSCYGVLFFIFLIISETFGDFNDRNVTFIDNNYLIQKYN